MTFKVYTKCVYGTDRVYPYNAVATVFATLLQVKTFNTFQLGQIEALGYTVEGL